jgi:hypothetical protein
MSNSYNNINIASSLNTGVISGTTVTSGSHLVYTSGSGTCWDNTISIDKDLTSFFEIVLVALGFDIKFEDFKKMSEVERNQLIRDIKLKTIL